EERLRIESLGSEHADALPSAGGEQLQRDHRIDRRLPYDGLAAVSAHRPLVVDDVVQVRAARSAVLAGAAHVRARTGAPAHAMTKGRRVGQTCRDNIPRRHLKTANAYRRRPIQAEFVQRLQDLDELRTQAVLE